MVYLLPARYLVAFMRLNNGITWDDIQQNRAFGWTDGIDRLVLPHKVQHPATRRQSSSEVRSGLWRADEKDSQTCGSCHDSYATLENHSLGPMC